MKIAVTGGNGDLGRALTPFLVQQGHTVVSIDRALPPAGSMWNPGGVDYYIANMTNYGEVIGVFRGCDAIIHLAAIRAPTNHPDTVVYVENTTASYHALSAAATLGINRVCMASSINAIGGVFSRRPRYDYFPVNEKHPTYSEEPYALSKWVLEQQGDAFARRFADMRIASLRFHWLLADYDTAVTMSAAIPEGTIKHLWAYTKMSEGCRACLLAITADFTGHEVFYIVAPRTTNAAPSLELAQRHYPEVPINGDLSGNRGFFDTSKAERLLGWKHGE